MDARPYPSADFASPPTTDTLDVARLSSLLVAGDETAYREFYAAYFPRLCRYLFVLTGGNDTAMKDALQATFIRVVKHVKVFPNEPAFWSWLTVLARSSVYDETRKRRRYFAFLDRFQQQSEASGFTVADQQSDVRLEQALERSLAQLPTEERELLEFKYFAHRPVREIAAQFQLSEKAVESRLTRARQNLREIIKREAKSDL